MRLKERLKNLASTIKNTIVLNSDVKNKAFKKATATVEMLIKERDTALEDNKNLYNDNAELLADNAELLAKNQTLTKHCTDLVSRVETMKKDMNTQIQFMGLINTAVNQLVDGIKELPERMESIEKGYLNPLPTEDKPE